MVNTDDFVKRLEHLLRHYHLSASGFADKIGVQRSSISHLLSGRNKPSLDFVLKVVNTFKEVDLYWLLNGKGDFPGMHQEELFAPLKNIPQEDKDKGNDMPNARKTSDKSIEKIIIFYSDGSFKAYTDD